MAAHGAETTKGSAGEQDRERGRILEEVTLGLSLKEWIVSITNTKQKAVPDKDMEI